MPSKTAAIKSDDSCRVHGAPARAANRTLLLMVLAGLCLVVWHVWAFGPTAPGQAEKKAFPLLLGHEVWDLLFGSHGMAAELWDVLPYFLVGIFLAGWIRTYKIAVRMQAKLRRYGFVSIFLASLVGILTPLCACGTLTTAISLLFAGLPLAPVMALLVTSPLLSPSTYLLTLNDLGPEWTVIRTIAAFSMGIFAGVVTHLLRDRGFRTESVFIEGGIPRGDFHDEAYPDERLRCNCKEKFGNRVAARTGNKFVVFLAKSWEMLLLVGKYVVVGIAIGTIVERYMPNDWLHRLFGRNDPFNIVWITLGTVPVFLHQVSASSIVYHIKSSLQGTLDNGAALAFMIGGPVTAIPTMVLFWTVFKKRVFFLYLFVCLAGTILIAYAFQSLVFVPHVDTGNTLLRNVRSLSGGPAAIIEKRNKDVRIVMDPGGKGMIAVRSNDLGSGGGVVVDAGYERFLDRSLDKYDNRNYIGNIAAWLEETGSSANRRTIFVSNVTERTDAFRRFPELLKQAGFRVHLAGRRDMPALSRQTLEDCSQAWIISGGEGLSDREIEAIAQFTARGGSLMLIAGPGADAPAGDRLSSRYGIRLAGSNSNGEELASTSGAYVLDRAAALLGKVLRIFHKA